MTTLRMPAKRTMFARAFRRSCPICGGGPLYESWLRVARNCPKCGLALTRGEDGYTLGALWFNLMASEGFTTLTFLVTLALTWPNPPWNTLQYTGPALAVIMPFIFYPFSRTLFLAFDLCIRPLEAGELAATSKQAGEPS